MRCNYLFNLLLKGTFAKLGVVTMKNLLFRSTGLKKNYHHKQTKFYKEKHVFFRTLWNFIIAYIIFNKLQIELGQDFSIPFDHDSLRTAFTKSLLNVLLNDWIDKGNSKGNIIHSNFTQSFNRVLRNLLSSRQWAGSGNKILERTGIVPALKELLGCGRQILNTSHIT